MSRMRFQFIVTGSVQKPESRRTSAHKMCIGSPCVFGKRGVETRRGRWETWSPDNSETHRRPTYEASRLLMGAVLRTKGTGESVGRGRQPGPGGQGKGQNSSQNMVHLILQIRPLQQLAPLLVLQDSERKGLCGCTIINAELASSFRTPRTIGACVRQSASVLRTTASDRGYAPSCGISISVHSKSNQMPAGSGVSKGVLKPQRNAVPGDAIFAVIGCQVVCSDRDSGMLTASWGEEAILS